MLIWFRSVLHPPAGNLRYFGRAISVASPQPLIQRLGNACLAGADVIDAQS